MSEQSNDLPDPAAAHDVDAKSEGEVENVPDYDSNPPQEDQRGESTDRVDVDVNVEYPENNAG